MEAITDVVDQEPAVADAGDAVVRATAEFSARKSKPALYDVVITVELEGVEEAAVLAARE